MSWLIACSNADADFNNPPTIIPNNIERFEPASGVLRVGVAGSFPYNDLHRIISEWATLFGPGPSYSRLMKFIPDMQSSSYMEVTCDLCVSYDRINDKTYKFVLNSSSKFHNFGEFDSRSVTSADVVFSLKQIADTESPHNLLMESVETMESISNSEVKFTLKYPDPDFLLKLASPYAVIIPSNQFADGLDREVIGSGPWTYKRGQSGQITLSSREEHPRGTNSAVIEFRIGANQDMVLRMLKNGSVDIARVPESSWPELEEKGYNSSVIHRQGRGVMFALNANKKPFDQIANRQAVFAALNPVQAMENSFGVGIVSAGLPLINHEWELPEGTMARFFNRDGIDLRNIEQSFDLYVANFGDDYLTHAEIIASQLKAKGGNFEVKILTRSEYLKQIWINKDFDAFLGPIPPIDLPNNFALSFVHSNGGMNVTGGTKELDELAEKFSMENDVTSRATIAIKLQEKLLDQSLSFMAAGKSERWVFNELVENFVPSMPMGSGDIWSYVKKNKPKHLRPDSYVYV